MLIIVYTDDMKKELQPIQDKLLALLKDNQTDPLTVRELQGALNASSTSVVAYHVQQLEKKGYLKRNPYNPRDYQIIHDSPEAQVTILNAYGMASCGPSGSMLEGQPEDRIPIASRLISFPVEEAFMLKAKGKSMEPKIHEGDYIILRRTASPEDGKIYACVNDGECLIKRMQLDKKNKGWLLVSLNPQYPPFVASEGLRVEGEVKSIISGKIS